MVVTAVTGQKPCHYPIIHNLAGVIQPFMFEVHTSPRKRTYRPIIISEARSEKKTADLSEEYSKISDSKCKH